MNENLARLVEFPTFTEDQQVNREALGYVGEYLETRGMLVCLLPRLQWLSLNGSYHTPER